MAIGFVEAAFSSTQLRFFARTCCLLLLATFYSSFCAPLAWSEEVIVTGERPDLQIEIRSDEDLREDCAQQLRKDLEKQQDFLGKLKAERSTSSADELPALGREIQVVVEAIVRIRLKLAYCEAMFADRDAVPSADWGYFDHPVLDHLGEEAVTRTFYNHFAATSCLPCRRELREINDWILEQYQSVLFSQLLWGPERGPDETSREAKERHVVRDSDLEGFEAQLAQRLLALKKCEERFCFKGFDDLANAPWGSVVGSGNLPAGASAPRQFRTTTDCPDAKCKHLAAQLARNSRLYLTVTEAIAEKEQEIADLSIDMRDAVHGDDRKLKDLILRRDAAYADLVQMRDRQSSLLEELEFLERRLKACEEECSVKPDSDADKTQGVRLGPGGKWKNDRFFPDKNGENLPDLGGPKALFRLNDGTKLYRIGEYGVGDFEDLIRHQLADKHDAGLPERAVIRSSQKVLSDPLTAQERPWGRTHVGLSDLLLEQLRQKNPSEVIVAVIDSGVDIGHPDLREAIWENPFERFNGLDDEGNGLPDDVNGWNFIDHNEFIQDDNGHGTLVAGIIASRGKDEDAVAGINPWARILPLKVTDSSGEGGSVGVAAAITYAVNSGARVINVSLGGDEFAAAEEVAINHALEKGALVIVAAGNGSANTQNFWPAGIEAAVTVAASDADDSSAAYSNFGSAVDIAAPGTNIMSLRAAGTDVLAGADQEYKLGANVRGEGGHLYVTSGTSFAAPYVAGVASLILSMNPLLSAMQVRNMLLQSARDIEAPGVDALSGYGRLDAAAALVADPDFYIEALISGVSTARQDGEVIVVINGTAAADRFDSAVVEMGRGEAPDVWEQVQSPLKKPARHSALAQLPGAKLREAQRWTLRLTVFHSDGSSREARFDLSLK